MLTLALIGLALTVFATLGANPLASKGAAMDRSNHIDGKPQTITVKNAAGDSLLVSYDVETLAEMEIEGFKPITPAEQTALNAANAKAAKIAAAQAPAVAAAAAAQAKQDAEDIKAMNAELLAAWRANKAKAAAPKV